MPRFSFLCALLLVFCVFAGHSQVPAQASKSDLEVKKLGMYVGHWTFEVETKASPLGPGGKYIGEQTIREILGGAFLENDVTTKGPNGETKRIDIIRYDSVNKNFPYTVYRNDGLISQGILTGKDGQWSFEQSFTPAGKQYFFKGTEIFEADHMSFTQQSEISTDGKTWVPFIEAKYTKVNPTTKK